jgi:hypothetical protein
MARAGHLPGTRLPRLSALGPFLLEFQHELAPPNVPGFIMRPALVILAWFTRRRTVSARVALGRSGTGWSWRAP